MKWYTGFLVLAVVLGSACTADKPANTPTPADATATTTPEPKGGVAPTDTATKPVSGGSTTPAKTTEPVKTVPKATDPKPTPAAKTTPAAPEAPKADAFNLPQEAAGSFYSIPTFNNDIDDLTVKLAGVKPWQATADQYAGQYYGSLDTEISELRISSAGPTAVTLTYSYNAEVASESGEIDYQEGERTFSRLPLAGSTTYWNASQPVYLSRGQFVEWTEGGRTYKGFLAHGYAKGKPGYLLFRKTK